MHSSIQGSTTTTPPQALPAGTTSQDSKRARDGPSPASRAWMGARAGAWAWLRLGGRRAQGLQAGPAPRGCAPRRTRQTTRPHSRTPGTVHEADRGVSTHSMGMRAGPGWCNGAECAIHTHCFRVLQARCLYMYMAANIVEHTTPC